MELKMNYHYTYFIHPFAIKEGKYQKYILKMLKDKNCKLKTFQKEKDLKTYQYFLPKTRDFLFSSFRLGNDKIKELKELPLETRAALLSKYPCNIFEYTIKKDIQGKIDDKKGIFFVISKIEIVCFETGICFLVMKTNIEDDYNFANLLNFNYKFRDINQEGIKLDAYDNIRLQTNSFESAETFRNFIKNITGSSIESIKLDIDTERFLTYSYTCVEQSAWNGTNSFDGVSHYFEKYVNVLPVDDIKKIKDETGKIFTISKWKYAKLAISKLGIMLFSSSEDMNNYTMLPDEFENQYLYTYIINLYKKIYLKRIAMDLKDPKQIKSARKKFIKFTKELWIQEITEDEIGTNLNHKIQDTLELKELYNEVKNQYDILYKDLNIEKNQRVTLLIGLVLAISLIFNVLNFILLSKN